MKRIIFILLLIIPIIGLGQGLTKTNLILEEKKGFKDIQLGKNILEYYSIVNPVSGSGSVKVEIKSRQVYKDITKRYHNHIHHESQPFYLIDNIETWVVDKKHEKYNTFPEGTQINKIIIHTHEKIIFQIIIIVDNPGWNTNLYNLYKKVFGKTLSSLDYCDGRYNKEEKDKRKHDCQITWYSDNVGLSVWSRKDGNTRFPVKSFWRVEYFYKKIQYGLRNEEDSLRNIEKNKNRQKLIDGF